MRCDITSELLQKLLKCNERTVSIIYYQAQIHLRFLESEKLIYLKTGNVFLFKKRTI